MFQHQNELEQSIFKRQQLQVNKFIDRSNILIKTIKHESIFSMSSSSIRFRLSPSMIGLPSNTSRKSIFQTTECNRYHHLPRLISKVNKHVMVGKKQKMILLQNPNFYKRHRRQLSLTSKQQKVFSIQSLQLLSTLVPYHQQMKGNKSILLREFDMQIHNLQKMNLFQSKHSFLFILGRKFREDQFYLTESKIFFVASWKTLNNYTTTLFISMRQFARQNGCLFWPLYRYP